MFLQEQRAGFSRVTGLWWLQEKKKKKDVFSGTGTEACLSELSPGACHIIGIKLKSYLRNQQIWKQQPYPKGAATVREDWKSPFCRQCPVWSWNLEKKQLWQNVALFGASGVLQWISKTYYQMMRERHNRLSVVCGVHGQLWLLEGTLQISAVPCPTTQGGYLPNPVYSFQSCKEICLRVLEFLTIAMQEMLIASPCTSLCPQGTGRPLPMELFIQQLLLMHKQCWEILPKWKVGRENLDRPLHLTPKPPAFYFILVFIQNK